MTPWLSLLVVRALLAVSSPLYWQRPGPVSPRCYVRPVLPTGLAAVFFLNKGKGNRQPETPIRRGGKHKLSPPPTPNGRVLLGGATHRVAGGMIMPPKGSTQRGAPSGRFFADFLIGEKVTRVPSMAKPCSRGAPASGVAGATNPA